MKIINVKQHNTVDDVWSYFLIFGATLEFFQIRPTMAPTIQVIIVFLVNRSSIRIGIRIKVEVCAKIVL
jgi:hypothetical protein